MDAMTTENLSVSLPQSDVRLLRDLARRMGWSVKRQGRKTAFELSLEEADRGEYTEYASVDDFEAQVLNGNGI